MQLRRQPGGRQRGVDVEFPGALRGADQLGLERERFLVLTPFAPAGGIEVATPDDAMRHLGFRAPEIASPEARMQAYSLWTTT